MKLSILFLCLFLLHGCANHHLKGNLQGRYPAKVDILDIVHRPFIKIYAGSSVQDSRINKKNLIRLIGNMKSKGCMNRVFRKIIDIFKDSDIFSKLTTNGKDYGLEIHLGGSYKEKNGVISFNPTVEAFYYRRRTKSYNDYFYQVRWWGHKVKNNILNTFKTSTINILKDKNDLPPIESTIESCFSDKINKKLYLDMILLMKKEINKNIKKIEKSNFDGNIDTINDFVQDNY